MPYCGKHDADDYENTYFNCLWVSGAEAYDYIVVVVLRRKQLIIIATFVCKTENKYI